MNQSFLSLTHLFGWRLRTTDGMTASLLDALLDTDQWTIRLLAAEAEGWAPERELLIAPRMVAGYPEQWPGAQEFPAQGPKEDPRSTLETSR